MPAHDLPPRKFRHSAALTVAAVVAFFGAAPLATSRLYLLPLLLVPIAFGTWAWRTGTDVTAAGLRIRALLGSRLIAWSHVAALVPAGSAAYAVLTTGRRVRLPAVPAAALPTIAGTEPAERGPEAEAQADSAEAQSDSAEAHTHTAEADAHSTEADGAQAEADGAEAATQP